MFVMDDGQIYHFPKDSGAYYQAVKLHLCLPGTQRKKALQDLKKTLESADLGYDQLVVAHGTPKSYAVQLNRCVPGYEYRKSWLRIPCLIVGILSAGYSLLTALVLGLYQLLLSHPNLTLGISPAASVGVIGGADGPTAVYVTAIPHGSTSFFLLVALLLSIFGLVGYYKLRHMKTSLK